MSSPSPDTTLPKSPLSRLVVLLVMVNLGLWLLAAYSIQRSYQQYSHTAQARVFNFSKALDETISGVIAKGDVALKAARDEILRQKASGSIKGEELHRFLARQKAYLPELDSIMFANAQGITVNSSNANWNTVSNITDRDYFIQFRDNPQDRLLIPRPVIGRISKKKVLLLTRRVSLADGSFGGVMIATLPVSYFEQLFSNQSLKTNLHIGLWYVDLQGISHFEALDKHYLSNREDAEPPRQWKELLSHEPLASGLFQADCPFDKLPLQYAFSRLDPYPLYVTVGLAEVDYLAGWRQERLVTCLGTTVITLISLLAGWLFYRNWQVVHQSLLVSIQQEQILEQRVEERTEQLEAANKELEAFSYSVSHDLRAPLRHLVGFVELLNKKTPEGLDKQSRHYLEVISQSATKMSSLVDDLLSFSRMGRAEMLQREINMELLLHEARTALQDELVNRQIVWKIGPLPSVTGDGAMLKQVLLNLLANAIKYTAREPVAEIEIGCRSADNQHEFFVRDNGVGFDMQYYDKLFGLFQRLHNSEEFEGNGVGLANVQRIIHRHGGRIWAEAEVGKGATFFFTLPA